MKRTALALSLAAAFLLAACAGSSAPAAKASTRDEVGKAVTTPLSDLNLVRAEIPPVLLAALKAPYARPVADNGSSACAVIATEVKGLDAALGADLDTPPTPQNPGLLERGGNLAGGAAVGAVRSAAEDVIPFRGWVRKLSGAERYSREVIAAITAGTVRRSYLKGLGEAKACQAPAAPLAAVAKPA